MKTIRDQFKQAYRIRRVIVMAELAAVQTVESGLELQGSHAAEVAAYMRSDAIHDVLSTAEIAYLWAERIDDKVIKASLQAVQSYRAEAAPYKWNNAKRRNRFHVLQFRCDGVPF